MVQCTSENHIWTCYVFLFTLHEGNLPSDPPASAYEQWNLAAFCSPQSFSWLGSRVKGFFHHYSPFLWGRRVERTTTEGTMTATGFELPSNHHPLKKGASNTNSKAPSACKRASYCCRTPWQKLTTWACVWVICRKTGILPLKAKSGPDLNSCLI